MDKEKLKELIMAQYLNDDLERLLLISVEQCAHIHYKNGVDYTSEEIKAVLKNHEDILHWHYSGSDAERLNSIICNYRNKSEKYLKNSESLITDMLTYLRALTMIIQMIQMGATHGEKNARVRGLIEYIEGTQKKLRELNIESMFSSHNFTDIFSAEYPYTEFKYNYQNLKDENKKLKDEIKILKEKEVIIK